MAFPFHPSRAPRAEPQLPWDLYLLEYPVIAEKFAYVAIGPSAKARRKVYSVCHNSTGSFYKGTQASLQSRASGPVNGLRSETWKKGRDSVFGDSVRLPAATLRVFLIMQIERHPSRGTTCFAAGL